MLFKWDENTHMYHQEDGTLSSILMLHRNMEKSDAKAQFNLKKNAPINPYTLKNEDFNMRELFFLTPRWTY